MKIHVLHNPDKIINVPPLEELAKCRWLSLPLSKFELYVQPNLPVNENPAANSFATSSNLRIEKSAFSIPILLNIRVKWTQLWNIWPTFKL